MVTTEAGYSRIHGYQTDAADLMRSHNAPNWRPSAAVAEKVHDPSLAEQGHEIGNRLVQRRRR